MNRANEVIVQDGGRWLLFRDPVRVLRADRLEDVLTMLEEVERAVDRGLSAAGFIAYEAGPAFDRAQQTFDTCPVPLLWFGVYRHVETLDSLPDAPEDFSLGEWQPTQDEESYSSAIKRIKNYIRAGDSYQVNYTFRLRADFAGDPLSLFRVLCRSQQASHCALIDTGDVAVCSASPELFFSLDGNRLVSRPMKGTSPRGLYSERDERLAVQLAASVKDCAENVMIVDMIRNDMGRVADSGTVSPVEMFTVEKYPTVFQMTSTVACNTSASLLDIMKAMFPCASITGAPKIRTMQIICELEKQPRGIYTGTAGFILPGRRARLNVAIRTVAVDRLHGVAEYGVGGGIVWDSTAAGEYAECRTKAAVLTSRIPEFDLLETMLWEPGHGYFLPDLHMERISRSAHYFCRPIDTALLRSRLAEAEKGFDDLPQRVRVTLAANGDIRIESTPLEQPPAPAPRKVRIAARPQDTGTPFAYHKTTFRQAYTDAMNAAGACDDVILWNNRNEVTESTIANVVVETDSRKLTPPVSCGLLAGTFRQHLLDRGEIEESVVTVDELRSAHRLYLVNSVRRWMNAELIDN